MLKYFEENDIDIQGLRGLGCDGTALNTGVDLGIIRRMELYLGLPIQHIICLLHTNELPLRHLFRHLDGETTGPTTFQGPIGKRLHKCETNPAVDFDFITNHQFPVIDGDVSKDLSRDQEYIYNISNVIRGHPNGDLDKALSLKIGPVNHSRWLTTASRILRLYISTERTDPIYKDLRTLAEFIIRSYAQVWFEVKCKPHIVYAAKHFFQMVKTTRYLPARLRRIIDKVLTTNFTAGHCESLLLTMLGDPLKKAQAITIIKQIRQMRPGDYELAFAEDMQEAIRKFRAPKFRFNRITSTTSDDDYDQLLNLTQISTLTEPPLTMEVPESQLSTYEVPKFPCHTQQTERIIRLVSEASQRVIGQENRHGYIVTTLYSRSITGQFDTKKDYNPHNLEELMEEKRKLRTSKK